MEKPSITLPHNNTHSSTLHPQIYPIDLYIAFFRVGLMGFGGVAAMARWMMVDRKAWLTAREYAKLYTLGLSMPGGNILNTSVLIGDHFCGLRGALAALSGLISFPILFLIGLGYAIEHFSTNPFLHTTALYGGSATVGLLLGSSLRLFRNLHLSNWGLIIAIAVFMCLAVLQISIFLTLIILFPLSLYFSYREST